MNRFFFDLHIHSCLSPCGDNDMTPANIAGMAALKGLQLAALTDHNSTKNCPAFFAECKKQGIVPVAGMELTTAEDIHLLCLFPELENAMEFGRAVDEKRVPVKNRPDIFGHQLIMGEDDEITGEEENLLINATTLSLDGGARLCREYGGVCHPAHIDRESGGVLAILGAFPEDMGFTSYEISASGNADELRLKYACLRKLIYVKCSDAHYLGDISEAENYIMLEDEPYSGALMRARLLEYLSGGC